MEHQEKIWHAEINGQRQGTLNIDELLQNGLTGDSLVWKEGMASWLAAKEVPEMLAAFNFVKFRNEIEMDVLKYSAEENADIRLQIERLEKSYDELLDEKNGLKAILKNMAEKDAELNSKLNSLKDKNEKMLNFKPRLTTELKALGREETELRSKLRSLWNKLIEDL